MNGITKGNTDTSQVKTDVGTPGSHMGGLGRLELNSTEVWDLLDK